jgi:8-oxo-dGTP diphosphatase
VFQVLHLGFFLQLSIIKCVKYIASSSIIIRPKDQKVLIGQRSFLKKLGPGEWETIGGSIEGNETPEECIKREIKEELKTSIKTCYPFKDYFSKKGVIKVFIITLESEPKYSPKDFENILWVSKKEIKDLNFVLNCKERLFDFFNHR